MDGTWLPIALGLIFTGCISGVLAGLLGIGGGIVIVPILFLVLQFVGVSASSAMSIATGTSLVIIIATSISSVRAHHQKGNTDLSLLKLWAPFIVFGAIVGAALSSRLGGVFASVVFGLISILVAMNMLIRANAKALYSQLPHKALQMFYGFITGVISVVMGIGGGALGVPILSAYNFPTHRAVGTSAAFGLIIAVPGVLFTLLLAPKLADAPVGTFGYINIIGVALIMPLSVLMAPLGVYLGSKLNGAMLKRVFALFLCISGIRMLFQALA